jgi:hypothetical protein
VAEAGGVVVEAGAGGAGVASHRIIIMCTYFHWSIISLEFPNNSQRVVVENYDNYENTNVVSFQSSS